MADHITIRSLPLGTWVVSRWRRLCWVKARRGAGTWLKAVLAPVIYFRAAIFAMTFLDASIARHLPA